MKLTAEQVRAIFMALDYQEDCEPVIVTDNDLSDERFPVALVVNAECLTWQQLMVAAAATDDETAAELEASCVLR